MENPDVERLRHALQSAFERSPELQPRPDFIAGLAQLRKMEAPRVRRVPATKWLAIAATFVLITFGGYWTFEARLSAGALREAVAGDHRYCALGLTTDGKAATQITSLPAVVGDEPGFRVLENVPRDDIPTSHGAAHVLNRHSCVFAGRRFAHIILQYRGTPVSLIVTRGRAPWSVAALAVHGVTMSQSRDLTVMSVPAPGYAVFVVGALPAPDLSPLVDVLSDDVVRALGTI